MASYFCVKSTPWYLSYLQTLHCKLSCNPRHNLHCNLCHNLLLLLTHPVQVQRVQTCEGLFSNWLNNSTSNYQNHYLWVVVFLSLIIKKFTVVIINFSNLLFFRKSRKNSKRHSYILSRYRNTVIYLPINCACSNLGIKTLFPFVICPKNSSKFEF